MRKILRWVIGVPIIVLVAGFAVANRQWTVLSLDPFHNTNPTFAIALPLWLLFIFGAFIGILVGYTAAWVAASKHRKLARDRAREIEALSKSLAESRKPDAPVDQTALMVPLPGIMP